MIVSLLKSPLESKRFRVLFLKDKKIVSFDFGSKGSRTYIDDRSEEERENYLKRHMANKTEKRLIDNLIPSSSLFSAYLLWGHSRDIFKNIKHLNDLLERKSA